MPEVDADGALERTADVQGTLASFADLLLPPTLVRNLQVAGFSRPSPVQQAAVPLGRFGADLIVQAKSGTGKTATFGIVAVCAVNAEHQGPQALVLEPTREVALQVQRTISALCMETPIKCCAFVGGLPVQADVSRLRHACQIVVGTPASHQVLDEADTLLAGGFVDDIAFVYGALPIRKQMLAFSATYTNPLLSQLRQLTNAAQEVMLCPQTAKLEGVKQLYVKVPSGDSASVLLGEKEALLLRLLGQLEFTQALVFCNMRGWAEAMADRLTQHGFPAAFTCGTLVQRRRMLVMEAARALRVRVLVSTDLNARGLDLPAVNLVVNMDVPMHDATYMHRVGRTGRFGTCGIAVSLVSPSELLQLQGIAERANLGGLCALLEHAPWIDTAGLPPSHMKLPADRAPPYTSCELPLAALDAQRRVAAPSGHEPCDEHANASVGHEQLATTAVEDLRWSVWQHRQAAYSYWWWQHRARSRRGRLLHPWAAPTTQLLALNFHS